MLDETRDEAEVFVALRAQERVGVVDRRVHVRRECKNIAERLQADGARVGDSLVDEISWNVLCIHGHDVEPVGAKAPSGNDSGDGGFDAPGGRRNDGGRLDRWCEGSLFLSLIERWAGLNWGRSGIRKGHRYLGDCVDGSRRGVEIKIIGCLLICLDA